MSLRVVFACLLLAGMSTGAESAEPLWANLGAGVALVRQGDKFELHELIGQTLPFSLGGRISDGLFEYVGDPKWGGDLATMVVRVNGRYGLISKEGREIVPATFDWVSNCSESGYATTYVEDRAGLYDCTTHREVLEPQFQMLEEPRKRGANFVAVRPGEKYGIFDLKGGEVLPATHSLLWTTPSGYFLGIEDGGLWWFTPKGKRYAAGDDGDIVPLEVGLVERPGPDGKKGLQDAEGKWIIPPMYDSVSCSDLCIGWLDHKSAAFFDPKTFKPVKQTAGDPNAAGFDVKEEGGTWTLLDRSGKTLLTDITIDVSDEDVGLHYHPGGFASAFTKRGWGVVDRSGKVIADFDHWDTIAASPRYDPFRWDGPMLVRSPRGDGVLNTDGRWLVPEGRYQRMGLPKRLANNRWVITFGTKDGKEGLLDLTSGRELVPARYDSFLTTVNDDAAYFWNDDGIGGVYAYALERVIEIPGYKVDEYYPRTQRLRVTRNKKYGLATLDGRMLVPPTYDQLSVDDHAARMWVANDQGAALAGIDGKLLTPFAFAVPCSMCGFPSFDWLTGTADVEKNGEKAVIDPDGKVLASSRDFGGRPEHVRQLRIASQTPVYVATYKRSNGGEFDKVIVNGKVYGSAGGDIGPNDVDAEFKDGLMAVRDGEKIGWINLDGEMVITPSFDHATSFFDGTALGQFSGHWFVIDRMGGQVKGLRAGIQNSMNSIQPEP